MGFDMVKKMHIMEKSSATLEAFIAVALTVASHTATDVGALDESLSGELTRRCPLRPAEARHEVDGFSILFTFGGFLPSMDLLISLLGHLDTEGSSIKFTSA